MGLLMLTAASLWIGKRLMGALGPWIVAGIGGLLLIAVAAALTQTTRLALTQRDLARMESARDAALRDYGMCKANRETLEQSLAAQNEAVDQIAQDCESESDAANDRARSVIQRPLPQDPDYTADAVNLYLDELLR